MKKELKIKNIFGEELDVLIEGNENADEIIIFVHGFGGNKHGKDWLFENFENEYLIMKFDQSGFGKSEGNQEEYTQLKAADDLNCILKYIREKYKNKTINICAHSMGGYITTLLSPDNINKTIFFGAEKLNSKLTSKNVQERILKNGGKVNLKGVSIYLRTSGQIQKIHKDFWKIFENKNYFELLEKFSKKTDLIVFKSKQDEMIGYDKKDSEGYQKIKTLKYIEINGDHNFTKTEDRKNLIEQIREFLEK